MATFELGTIIKKRREMLGLSRLSIAQDIGTTPNMLANFEDNNSTLRPDLLAKCLDRLGIDISTYDKRAELAGFAAHVLMSKEIGVEELMTMSKYELAKVTQLPQIACLLDMTEEDQKNIIRLQESGLVSMEGTYLHFRSLLAYLLKTPSNPNSPQAQKGRDEAIKSI